MMYTLKTTEGVFRERETFIFGPNPGVDPGPTVAVCVGPNDEVFAEDVCSLLNKKVERAIAVGKVSWMLGKLASPGRPAVQLLAPPDGDGDEEAQGGVVNQLQSIKSKVFAAKARYDHVAASVRDDRAELYAAEDRLAHVTEAQAVVQAVAQTVQERVPRPDRRGCVPLPPISIR